MKIELKQLQADFGTTFVYITHDQSEALVLSDHVARHEQRPLRAGRHTAGTLLLPANAVRGEASSAPTTGSKDRQRGSTATSSNFASKQGLTVRAKSMGTVNVGDAAAAFVRPEIVSLARAASELSDCRARRCAPVSTACSSTAPIRRCW